MAPLKKACPTSMKTQIQCPEPMWIKALGWVFRFVIPGLELKRQVDPWGLLNSCRPVRDPASEFTVVLGV